MEAQTENKVKPKKRKSSLKENPSNNSVENSQDLSLNDKPDYRIKETPQEDQLETLNLFNEWLDFIKSKKVQKSFLKGVNIRIVKIFLEEIMKSGGYIEATARQYFEENFLKFFFSSSKEFSQFYETYVLPFERHKNEEIPKNFNPKLLLKCKTVNFSEFENLRKSEIKMRKCFKEDIVILRGLSQGYGIKESLFTPENISIAHGNDLIDIRNQNPNFTGIHLGRMNMQASKMKVSDYVEYMEEFTQEGKNPLEEELIKFAVNIDCGNWSEICSELEKLPPEILYNSNFDALRYCRNHILGVTQPQIYMKIGGCWTGGHQENLNLQAINLNHGPSDCVWYAIDSLEVPNLRSCFMKKYNYDIYNNEGLWFLTIEECHSFGIPLTKVIQRPGDIVVLAPGTIHWVKSLGRTVNSAWNFATKNLQQFESMIDRFHENKKIKFRNLVPLKTLFLDFFIQEFLENEAAGKFKDYLIDKLIFLITEECQKLNEIRHFFDFRSPQQFENNLICDLCFEETFLYYGFCQQCYTFDEKFMCLDCLKVHGKPESCNLIIFKKGNTSTFVKVFNEMKEYKKISKIDSQKLLDFCKGVDFIKKSKAKDDEDATREYALNYSMSQNNSNIIEKPNENIYDGLYSTLNALKKEEIPFTGVSKRPKGNSTNSYTDKFLQNSKFPQTKMKFEKNSKDEDRIDPFYIKTKDPQSLKRPYPVFGAEYDTFITELEFLSASNEFSSDRKSKLKTEFKKINQELEGNLHEKQVYFPHKTQRFNEELKKLSEKSVNENFQSFLSELMPAL